MITAEENRQELQRPFRARTAPANIRRRNRDDARQNARREEPLDLANVPSLNPEDMALELQSFRDGQSSGRPLLTHKSFIASSAQTAPRLLDRTACFQQSHGRLNVRRVSDKFSVRPLRREDIFHTIVSMRTSKVVALAVAVLVGSWICFALLFWAVSDRCGLEVDSYVRALYLAIETIETIGYGVPDPYWNECGVGLFVIAAAALWESLLNALLISIVYTRVSRAQARATSVCFTQKAIVREIGEHCYFMFQLCDFRKHQLCEAHVRLYGVQHSEAEGGVTFHTRFMRLQHPDDELGGMLLLALPQLIVHRIDAWSPLCPPQHRTCAGGTPAGCLKSFTEVPQRSCDAENGQRELKPTTPHPSPPSLLEVAQHLAQAEIEVLCVVEGIEPSTSGTLQARCSYTNDDIVYNANFQRCVSRAPDGACEVNFDAFHELIPCGDDGVLVQSLP